MCRLLTIVAGWMWLLVAVILVALLCTAVRHSAGRASASPKPLRRVMLLNLLFAASARSLFFLADPFYGKRRLPALVVAFAYGLPYPALNSATALLFVSTRHFFSRTMRGQSVSMFVARRGLFNMVIVCSALEYVVQIFADVARCLGHTRGDCSSSAEWPLLCTPSPCAVPSRRTACGCTASASSRARPHLLRRPAAHLRSYRPQSG